MRYNPNGDDSPRPRIDDYLEATGNTKEAESYKRSTYAWNPNLQDGSIIRITKSSIGTFAWCPQQYYIEKFKGMRGEQVDHHIRGLNVHDMMEWFWANFTDEQEKSVLKLINENDITEAKKLFVSVVPAPPTPYEFGEEEQIEQWMNWQFTRLISTQGEQWRPVGVEANIQATRFVEVDGEQIPITHWGWEFPGGGINGGDGPTIHYEDAKGGGKYAMRSVEKSLVKLIKAHMDMDFPPMPFLGRFKEGLPMEEQNLKCQWCSFEDHCEFWTITDEYLDRMEEE